MSQYAKVEFDLFCEWQEQPPTYRIFVNRELYAERNYIWKDVEYVRECLQVQAEPGIYEIYIDDLAKKSRFRMRNLNIHAGTARVVDHNKFEIIHAG